MRRRRARGRGAANRRRAAVRLDDDGDVRRVDAVEGRRPRRGDLRFLGVVVVADAASRDELRDDVVRQPARRVGVAFLRCSFLRTFASFLFVFLFFLVLVVGALDRLP